MSTPCDPALRQGLFDRLSSTQDATAFKSLAYLLANATYEEYQHAFGGGGDIRIPIVDIPVGLKANFSESEFRQWQTNYKQQLQTSELQTLKTTTANEVASRYARDILDGWNKCIDHLLGFGSFLDTSVVDADTAQFRIFWKGYPGVGTPLKVTGSRITGGSVISTYNDQAVPAGQVLPTNCQISINSTVGGTIQRDGTQTISLEINFDAGPVVQAKIPPISPILPPQSYDAVRDFSPSGGRVWSYGYKTQITSALNRYGPSAPIGAGILWIGERFDPQGDPGIVCNSTGVVASYGGVIVHPPNMLNLHPGPSGEYSVLRWTAPDSGTYHLEADFQGLNSNPGTTSNVVILHNNATIFSSNINGFGASSAQHFPPTEIDVAAGDTIDFCVGWGSNNDYHSDSTGVRVLISSL